ncbi:MAG: ABC transporter permease [Planctomycetes bacterium]|nr:ABC transporter permease [Planctomycetota bacterium]
MYKLFLMWRYLTRRALSLVAVVALTLSVGALVVAPSIMSGFQEEFYKRIRGTLSDLTMSSGQPHSIPEDPMLELRLEKLPHVLAVAPFVENPALDKHLEQVDYCFVRGVDPAREAKVSKFADYLMSPRAILEEVAKQHGPSREILDALEGKGEGADPELRAAYEEFYPEQPDTELIYEQLNQGTPGDPDTPTCLVGVFYLRYWGVDVGDTVILTTASANGEISEERAFKIVGAFQTGVSEKDRRLIVTSLRSLQEFIGVEGRLSGYSFKLEDYNQADETRAALSKLVRAGAFRDLNDQGYYLRTWEQHNEQLIKAVKMEKLLIWLMTLLIVVAASATIFLVLFMSVHTKVREIGILRAMGANSMGVLALFVTQGLVLALVGILFGYVLGNLIGWNINEIADGIKALTGWHPFPPEVYYIDKIPYKPSPSDTAINVAITLTLGMLAAFIPGILAALRPPLKAIRYD